MVKSIVATVAAVLLGASAARADDEATARVEALGSLRRAELRLASGDTDGIDADLSRAETVLPGKTRVDIEAARAELAQADLYRAREYIAWALAERRVRP